jgi:hypothetical protein
VAVRAGDRAAITACFAPPPPGVADPTPLVWHNVARRRFVAAVASRFGEDAAEELVPYRQYLSDRNIDEILARWPAPAKDVVIDGDRAYFVDASGRRLGEEDDFSDYVRVDGRWRKTFGYPDPKDRAAVAAYERRLAPYRRFVEELDDLTAAVEKGDLANLEDVREQYHAARKRVLRPVAAGHISSAPEVADAMRAAQAASEPRSR